MLEKYVRKIVIVYEKFFYLGIFHSVRNVSVYLLVVLEI
jgi:hypothetical protein